MGKVGITHTSLLRQNPHMGFGLFSFIISFHLLFPSFLPSFHICSTFPSLWDLGAIVCGAGGGATNLIKVIGTGDANNVIRSPRNYLQNLMVTQRRSAVGHFSEPRGRQKKQQLTTNQTFHSVPQTKQSVWETHALFIWEETEHGENIADRSEKRDSCLGWGPKEASFHNLFCLINNVAGNQ